MQHRPENCISCGRDHSAVVTVEGRVVCWGSEDATCEVPPDLENVIAVSGGVVDTKDSAMFRQIWVP
jgi:alpha-tubulin suppressor-like RCC1 family protein